MRFYHLGYGDMRNGQEGDLFPIDELLGPLMYHAGGSEGSYLFIIFKKFVLSSVRWKALVS